MTSDNWSNQVNNFFPNVLLIVMELKTRPLDLFWSTVRKPGNHLDCAISFIKIHFTFLLVSLFFRCLSWCPSTSCLLLVSSLLMFLQQPSHTIFTAPSAKLLPVSTTSASRFPSPIATRNHPATQTAKIYSFENRLPDLSRQKNQGMFSFLSFWLIVEIAIQCDETKPSCMRCTHGQRDVRQLRLFYWTMLKEAQCAWPEGAPVRRRSTTRKDSLDADGRPSTAGSSISDSSTPPTRDHTPPHLPHSQPLELGLPPLASRRITTSLVTRIICGEPTCSSPSSFSQWALSSIASRSRRALFASSWASCF